MKKDLGIGIIGLGMGANLLGLNSMENTSLIVNGIMCTTQSKADRMAKEYGVKFATTDYRELLKKDDIQIIGVYSPDDIHIEHCQAALKAGKHIICTKPVTVNNKQSQILVDLVRKTGLKFIIGMTYRFTPQFITAKNMIEAGDIGEIFLARGQYVHDISPWLVPGNWRLERPQDFLYGGGSHPIDALMHLMGEIDEVTAYAIKGNTVPAYPMEDNFMLNCKFKSGTLASVSVFCGVVEPPMHIIRLDFFGTKGSLSVTHKEGKDGWLKVVSKRLQLEPLNYIYFPAETESIGGFQHLETEIRMALQMEKCIKEDLEPVPGILDGAKVIAVGDAAWKSIKDKGRPAKVKTDF